jgi:hypothetical protein
MRGGLKIKAFVKLRRGIVEHLADMTPSELTLFIAYLTQAEYRGDGHGRACYLTIEEAATICGWTPQWTIEVKKKLIERGFIHSLKKGVFIPKYDNKKSTILDCKKSNSQENLPIKVKNPLPQESTILDSQNQQCLTIGIKDTLPQNPTTPIGSEVCSSPKNNKKFKNSKNCQEAKPDYSFDPQKHLKGPEYRRFMEKIKRLGEKYD